VLQAIDAEGPHKDGDRFVAYTSWDVSWAYDLPEDARGIARVADPVVKVGAHVILPNWTGSERASAGLRKALAKSFGAIEEHEAEHVALAIEAGQRALTALRGVKPARGLTRARVDAIVGREVAVVQARERRHDLVTKNGLTQGTAI